MRHQDWGRIGFAVTRGKRSVGANAVGLDRDEGAASLFDAAPARAIASALVLVKKNEYFSRSGRRARR